MLRKYCLIQKTNFTTRLPYLDYFLGLLFSCGISICKLKLQYISMNHKFTKYALK